MFNSAISTVITVAKSPVTHAVVKSASSGLAITSGISFVFGAARSRVNGVLTKDESYRATLNKGLPILLRHTAMSMELDSWLRSNGLTEEMEITSWSRIKADLQSGLYRTVIDLPENIVMNAVNQVPFASMAVRFGSMFGAAIFTNRVTQVVIDYRAEIMTRKYLATFGTTLTQVLGEYRHGQTTPRNFTSVKFTRTDARQSA